jgi:hypothetical protein
VDFGFAVEEPQAPEGTLSSAHVHSFRRIPKIATSVSAKSCSLFGGGGSHPEPPPCRSGRTFRRKTFGPGGRRRGWTLFFVAFVPSRASFVGGFPAIAVTGRFFAQS